MQWREIHRKLIRRFNASIYRPQRMLTPYVTKPPIGVELVRLGTAYGGWTIVDTPEFKNGIAVLCGAGEDISFDLAFQARYGCNILIVDPTPRAISHFNDLCVAYSQNKSIAIDSSAEYYKCGNVDFTKIDFVASAIWHCNGKLKFWSPLNQNHVSHSLTNLQRSQRYIEVKAETLSGILSRRGYRSADISLLKLDVEGAETQVIRSICDDKIFPGQILVEFDEMHFPNAATRREIKSTIERLSKHGYRLVHFDGISNCLFLRDGVPG